MAVKTISKADSTIINGYSGHVISPYEHEERWANMTTELYSLQHMA